MQQGPSIASWARRTAEARRVLMNTFASDLGPTLALDLMGLTAPTSTQLAFADLIATNHHDTLSRSSLFLADPDMIELLDAAAPTMPDQELHETDIITPNGFVYFAEMLPERSGIPPEVPIRAMSWAYLHSEHPLLAERGDGQPAVLITAYVQVREVMAARGLTGPDHELAPNAPGLIPNATVVWSIGSLIGEVFGEVPPEVGYTPGFYQRVLAAFWTLTQQPKMINVTDERLQATDQRRYRRAGVVDPNAPVHVVRLHGAHVPTDPSGTSAGSGGRGKMTVRALVRGHWRRQWYATVQAHRHIWIDPHWRGPEDAPVIGGERVFLAHGPKADPGRPPRQ